MREGEREKERESEREREEVEQENKEYKRFRQERRRYWALMLFFLVACSCRYVVVCSVSLFDEYKDYKKFRFIRLVLSLTGMI